jgi:hypothetical protein
VRLAESSSSFGIVAPKKPNYELIISTLAVALVADSVFSYQEKKKIKQKNEEN